MRGLTFSATMAVATVALLLLVAPTRQNAESADLTSGERARSASRFVDSIGLNVHFSYRDTAYGNTPRIDSLLKHLGVRHLRDGMTLGQMDVCAHDRSLALGGIRFTYITKANPTSSALQTWVACTGSATEAFEGLNEYDISHPPSDHDWATTVRASQHALYRAVKSIPQLAAIPVLAPSLTSEAAFHAVGDLSAVCDLGNIHNYYASHEPETDGWGLNGYGSLAFNMRIALTVDAGKPLDSTETGYGTDRAAHTVDDATQAIYLPRLLLEQFATGIRRTFLYEFVDEGAPPYGHYGIVDDSLAPKPAYVALASLIGSLSDTAAPSHAGTLNFSIDGAGADVRHVLLQKRDGRFVLVIWIAAPSFDTLAHTASVVAPQTVHVRVDERLRQAGVSAYGADWRLHRIGLPVSAPLRITITDRITLLDLKPAVA